MSETVAAGVGYPPPLPHEPIAELFSDVYWVQGSVRFGPGVRFNRNMMVLRHDDALTIISPVRLSAEGETALDALGTVKHVVRIGNYHGMDDRYYVDHYGAEYWAQEGSSVYPEPKPDHVLTEGAELPVPDADFIQYGETKFPEGAIHLKRHGGLLITADSVPNHERWPYTSIMAWLIMHAMGFGAKLLIGPPWKKMMTPEGGLVASRFRPPARARVRSPNRRPRPTLPRRCESEASSGGRDSVRISGKYPGRFHIIRLILPRID